MDISVSRGGSVWNPQGLSVPPVPGLQEQLIAEYFKDSPSYLTGSLTGDIGFDPLCITAFADPPTDSPDKFLAWLKELSTAEARNKKMLAMTAEEQAETVMWMRNAELKHARLAMLAAAGWPLSELWSFSDQLVETQGRAPSLFNGHLFDYFPFLVLAFGGLSYFELQTKETVKDGDYSFDPLGVIDGLGPRLSRGNGEPPRTWQGLKWPTTLWGFTYPMRFIGNLEALKLAEIKNGRAAMMAITGFSVQEFVRGTPVIAQTPILFKLLGGVDLFSFGDD